MKLEAVTVELRIGHELVIRKTRMPRICRDNIRASRCIIPYIRIGIEWVVAGPHSVATPTPLQPPE